MPDFTLSHADDPGASTEKTEQRQDSLDFSLGARVLTELAMLDLSHEQTNVLAAMIADYHKQAMALRLIEPPDHEPPVITHDAENKS